MTRTMFDYGIDLGTTNSSIARMERGVPVVLRNEFYRETTPSFVYVSPGGRLCTGEEALKRFKRDAARTAHAAARGRTEFKTLLGTDTVYVFDGLSVAFTPEMLCAEILKTLKGYAREDVEAAVIAVPAAFRQVQIEAAQEAARLAGFKAVEFVPEPYAASAMFGLRSRNPGAPWLVFDLGGGTFDAVLMHMSEGIMKVTDIAGDNHLGGKNIDALLVDSVLLPALNNIDAWRKALSSARARERLRELLKWLYAEDAKIALSSRERIVVEIEEGTAFDGNGNELPGAAIEITRDTLERLCTPLIDRALDISRRLLERNHIAPADLATVLLIGGPTFIPAVRRRVREELCERADWSVDPMTAVAAGAALLASAIARPAGTPPAPAVGGPVHLTLSYPATTLESCAPLGIKVAASALAAPTQVRARRSDDGWFSDWHALKDGGALIELNLLTGQTSTFIIELRSAQGNLLTCDPNTITILQGLRFSNPPLPYDICVEATTPEGDRLIPVLRRGQVLPASGTARGLRSKTVIHAGVASDILRIPVFEGHSGTRAVHNSRAGEVVLSGARVKRTLPEGSEVEVSIQMDASRRKKVSVYIPYLDETFEEVMEPLQKTHTDITELRAYLRETAKRIEELGERVRHSRKASRVIAALQARLEVVSGEVDADREGAIERIRGLNRDLDAFEHDYEQDVRGGKISAEIQWIARMLNSRGDAAERIEMKSMAEQTNAAIAHRNWSAADGCLQSARSLYWRVFDRSPDLWMNALFHMRSVAAVTRWRDAERALALIEQGERITRDGFKPELRSILRELWRLELDGDDGQTDILECVKQ